jgi:hypothetical protein
METGSDETPANAMLDTSAPQELDASDQLALGTMRLEGTEQAVTPEQAATLLPLWQAIQGGSLQSDAEMNAVVSQIEATMTPEQVAAIAAMQLTQEDWQAWMQEQGVNIGAGEGTGPMGGGQELSEEERAERMAQIGIPEGVDPSQMSEEDRAALRATMEASGAMPARDGAGAGPGRANMMLKPLIDLLTEKATG